jgi:hypothetical protein
LTIVGDGIEIVAIGTNTSCNLLEIVHIDWAYRTLSHKDEGATIAVEFASSAPIENISLDAGTGSLEDDLIHAAGVAVSVLIQELITIAAGDA